MPPPVKMLWIALIAVAAVALAKRVPFVKDVL